MSCLGYFAGRSRLVDGRIARGWIRDLIRRVSENRHHRPELSRVSWRGWGGDVAVEMSGIAGQMDGALRVDGSNGFRAEPDFASTRRNLNAAGADFANLADDAAVRGEDGFASAWEGKVGQCSTPSVVFILRAQHGMSTESRALGACHIYAEMGHPNTSGKAVSSRWVRAGGISARVRARKRGLPASLPRFWQARDSRHRGSVRSELRPRCASKPVLDGTGRSPEG